MGRLRRRLEVLELGAGVGADPLVVIVRCFDDGPLTGYRVNGRLVQRREVESERALQDRAVADGHAVGKMLVLREVRKTTPLIRSAEEQGHGVL